MPAKVKKERESDTVNLKEIAERGPPKEDINLRVEENKRLLEERRKAEEQRLLEVRQRLRRRRVLLLALAFSLCGIGALAYYFSPRRNPEPVTQQPEVVASPEGVTVTKGRPSDFGNYIFKKATIELPREGSFDVYALDFDRHTFLKGKALLEQQEVLEQTLSGLQSEPKLKDAEPEFQKSLPNSWAVIFAGASFEDRTRYNRQLCRDRVDAVACMLAKVPEVAGLGYWKLPAGEYKSSQPGKPALSEEDEDELAAKLGEEGLLPQRRLIVLFISPRTPPPPQDAHARIMSALTESLYEHDLLPDDYKVGRLTPTPLRKADLKCEAENP